MDELVFAFDNNHYTGFCELMTRKAFDAWWRDSDGDSPITVEAERVQGGAEALARGETSGDFSLVE